MGLFGCTAGKLDETERHCVRKTFENLKMKYLADKITNIIIQVLTVLGIIMCLQTETLEENS